jgi:hypothetical protein
MIDWSEVAFVIKELILPVFTILATLFAIWVGYRKGIFSRVDAAIPQPQLPGEATQDATSPLTEDKFDQYHLQSLSQSRISFWFSLVFASIGFAIIATSAFAYDKKNYAGIVAGTIIDAVSALFFYQSNKARQLMSEFFDKLRADRNLQESLKLSATVDDPKMRNALQVTLSLYFSGFNNFHALARDIIGVPSKWPDEQDAGTAPNAEGSGNGQSQHDRKAGA